MGVSLIFVVLCAIFVLMCTETIFSDQHIFLFAFFKCILFPSPNLLATALSFLTVWQSTSWCHYFCLIVCTPVCLLWYWKGQCDNMGFYEG